MTKANAERDRPIVSVAMLGARMHYAVPRALSEAGLLYRFYTDSYVGNKPYLKAALESVSSVTGTRAVRKYLGRDCRGLDPSAVQSFEFLGLWYAWSRYRARNSYETEAVYIEAAKRFASSIVRSGLGDANTVWGFNTASLELFEDAKLNGRRCFLEQTYLPYELEAKLLRAEAERWVGWQHGTKIESGSYRQAEREKKEWRIADRIVVGSEFVAAGLRELGVEPERISVIPYGVDVMSFHPHAVAKRDMFGRPGSESNKLRVLFAGEVGLRKGVPYLLEALNEIGSAKVEARFAGRIALAQEKISKFEHVAKFLGVVPRSAMPELYRWADVFVLPSIVEGSATVIYEALMSGVPVIATLNSGSIVEHGFDGRTVPVGDTQALKEALLSYLYSPDVLHEEAKNAAECVNKAGYHRYARDIKFIVS